VPIMEILTILKANLKKKKGTFICIVILMTIITTILTAIISVRDNYLHGLKKAYETAGSSDVMVLIPSKAFTDALRYTVENNKLVESVQYYSAVITNKVWCQKTEDNTYFATQLREGILLYNDNLSDFCEEVPSLSSGEIYLPLGLKEKFGCALGDTITIEFIENVQKDFVIKGFVQEPMMGAFNIGWKQVFMCESDLDTILKEASPYLQDGTALNYMIVQINQSNDSKLSPTKFQKQLNLETKICDLAMGTMNIDQSRQYTIILPEIILSIVFVFIGFLFLIVLIIVSHSIGTEIEIEYTTLGILKAQGYDNKKIRAIFLIQYVLMFLLGIVIGSIIAIPIQSYISSAFQAVTGVMPDKALSIGKNLLFAFIIISCSFFVIFIKTRKIMRISPVRAIAGGRKEIYFDSRINVPVTDKFFSLSLAFRQFTSAKKRYMGAIFIVIILTFFMTLVNLFGNLLASREALGSIGIMISDIEVYPNESPDRDLMSEIEKIVEAHTPVDYKNQKLHYYVSLNGENISCEMFKYPEYISGVIKGRAPLYENEILITKAVSEALDLRIGDKVIVSKGDREEECIITGFYQTIMDLGMSFAINFELAEKLGYNLNNASALFIVQDKDEVLAVIEEIHNTYGDFIGVNNYTETQDPMEAMYNSIVNGIKVIIYFFSVIFAFVVVLMVCSKTFIQERQDIGILKSLGFTVNMLRLQFAVRFFIIALIGALLGTVFSAVLAKPAMHLILGSIGLSKVVVNFTVASIFIPIFIISISFFIFAYMASKKIKKVEVKELIVE